MLTDLNTFFARVSQIFHFVRPPIAFSSTLNIERKLSSGSPRYFFSTIVFLPTLGPFLGQNFEKMVKNHQNFQVCCENIISYAIGET